MAEDDSRDANQGVRPATTLRDRLILWKTNVQIWLFAPRRASLFSRTVQLAMFVLIVVLTVRSVTESSRTRSYVNRVVPAAIDQRNSAFCTTTGAQISDSEAYSKIFNLLIQALGSPNPHRPAAQEAADREFVEFATEALTTTKEVKEALIVLNRQLHCHTPPPPPHPSSLPSVPSVSPSN